MLLLRDKIMKKLIGFSILCYILILTLEAQTPPIPTTNAPDTNSFNHIFPFPAGVFTNSIDITASTNLPPFINVVQRTTNFTTGIWKDLYMFSWTNNVTNWIDTNAPGICYYRIGAYCQGPLIGVTNN